jgi:hypothetical protein
MAYAKRAICHLIVIGHPSRGDNEPAGRTTDLLRRTTTRRADDRQVTTTPGRTTDLRGADDRPPLTPGRTPTSAESLWRRARVPTCDRVQLESAARRDCLRDLVVASTAVGS